MEPKKTIKKTAKKLGLSQRVAEQLASRLLEAWFDGEFDYEMIFALPSFSYEERGIRRHDEMTPFCIIEKGKITGGGLYDDATTPLNLDAKEAISSPKKIVKMLVEDHNRFFPSSPIKMLSYSGRRFIE